MNQYSPDVLATGLDVVFCGINPAATAAADGHNFSNRSNRFWEVLHQSGFCGHHATDGQRAALVSSYTELRVAFPRGHS
jgi:G:T/U-mismatch repair DNA glycosylase